jgi:hypothetical protein
MQVTCNINMPISFTHLFNDCANGVGNRFKNIYLCVQLLYVGQCGQTETIWCLINLQLKLICSYFTEERTGFGNEHNFKGMRRT